MRGLQERRAVVKALNRAVLPIAIAAVVVAADQTSKTWAQHHTSHPRHVFGPLTLSYTLNPGAAFGLGRGFTSAVEVVVVVMVLALLVFGRRASRDAGVVALIGMGLLLGGAVGNLVDRAVRNNQGSVIDFIDAARIGTRDLWPTFNLADAAIVVGAVILVLTASNWRRPASSKAKTGANS